MSDASKMLSADDVRAMLREACEKATGEGRGGVNHNFIDLSNCRFGRLTAIDFERRSGKLGGRERIFWHCKCDCGEEAFICAEVLRRGDAHSCGCLQRELAAVNMTTHGARRTRLYRTWTHILSRCRNSKVPQFHNYGGRGISICKEWEHSFEAFAAYVGQPPSLAHSIDRYPNMNGNYEPGNVRWATSLQQARNRRGLIMVGVDGRMVCLAEAAETVGIPYGTVYCRIFKHGWTIERTLTTPSRKKAV